MKELRSSGVRAEALEDLGIAGEGEIEIHMGSCYHQLLDEFAIIRL